LKKFKTPEELAEKIKQLRESKKPSGEGAFLGSLSLIWSIGFTFLFALGGSFFLGRKIAQITGIELLFPVCLILGILFGGFMVYKLLKPYL